MKALKLHVVFSFVLVFTFAVGLASPVFAQVGQATVASAPYANALDAIEAKLDARRKEFGIPGVAFAIVKDDQIIYLKGLGYKDFERKIPVTPDTQFEIGSATKAFTALSVLMAQDEGKLSLDDSPKKYLPYFKMYDPEADKNITIRDLLSHSSGLNRTDLAMMTGRLKRAELIEVAAHAKPTAKLREKFQYQNIMFAAAGEIVANVERTTWEKFVPARILKPLGMTNTTMSVAQMKRAKDVSLGYDYNMDTRETTRRDYREIQPVAPAGSINSSARDMAEWVRFVLNRGVVDGKRLVSEAGYNEWIKPQMKVGVTSSYGFGWFLQNWNGMKVVQHGGNIDGFNSLVAMVPERKIGFVMLTNVSGSPLGEEMIPVVWKNLIGSSKNEETLKPAVDTPPKTSAPVSAAAKELVGKYESDLASAVAEIAEADGKITFQLPGQPPFEIVEKAKDSYSLAPLPADSYVLNVVRDPAGKVIRLVIKQPEGEFGFNNLSYRGSGAPALMATDALMQKVTDAQGGEANIRRIQTRVTTFDMDLVHQGVQGRGTTWTKWPNKSATATTLTALGKKIMLGYDYWDGAKGGEANTLGVPSSYTGKQIDEIRLANDQEADLKWRETYKSIEIKGTAKVGDEECYRVVFTPVTGTKFTNYYSTKTFYLLKREGVRVLATLGNIEIPYSVIFSDYRIMDGVTLPFRTVSNSIGNGDIIVTVRDIKHNVPIDDKVFALRKLKF